MDEAPVEVASKLDELDNMDEKGQTQLILAQLMEGGQEDGETCAALDKLTKLLNDDIAAASKGKTHESVTLVVDDDCVDTILSYLDMRQAEAVRGHATLTVSAYLKAGGENAAKAIRQFFFDRVGRGTYDDYIVAFCVSAALFPVAPDLTAEIFLTEGFLPSLGQLMRRTWKSRKVETACLEMLNAASMNTACREAIFKYCVDWLEEVVDQDPDDLPKAIHSADPEVAVTGGSIAMRRHSEVVQNLAAVILAKLRAVPSQQQQQDQGARIQPAVTTIEDLTKKFTNMILEGDTHGQQHSIEGLAYTTIQPHIKEEVASDGNLLKKLVTVLQDAPPRSPLMYGTLSVFNNLTRYQPAQSEEQKRMHQLKAYANAAGKIPPPNPLNDDEHTSARCVKVFKAGLVPVLVGQSRQGSAASLSIIVSILYALSVTSSLRGQLAQQGAVPLLIGAHAALPESDAQGKRTAAQALARILISINPSLVFGGTRARPLNSAIRPLVTILPQDPAADTRDLLPTFESLMALTNLASTDDDARNTIIRTAWDAIEEQLLSSNTRVSKAAVELVCNLVQSVEGVALYAESTPQAANRLHILLALADAEEEGTRSAAGGALATLTPYEEVVRGILKREKGVDAVLGLCAEGNEDLRHRGAVAVYNMVALEGDEGKRTREKIRQARGVEILTECAKQSRRAEVVEVTVQALKLLLED
ncbi:myosin-binding striated muscle assembly central-domain-containing protein [Microdochium trichocladiopsis]|uniref:Myosin-binding striated muscle assembly central-domain-containing protein n=1 Tax=Microdochium trichocladiopsis TaxID=1682393 RepID=A0A9P8YG16_9PEZI|nr:myosin-binding striated muscle assembly central-domain-containing protein [Microdochium trichocladiopsis]KAH7039846.1 myosin-binding striated muscle assembly central-domain-containing protein [Microdochium trichocladiopsis]